MALRLLKAQPVAIDLAFDEAGAGVSAPGLLDARASGTGGGSRFGSARTWRLFAVLLLLTVGLRLPAFFVDVFNSDETFLATQAQVINEGGRLYEDATDRKPPLVPYLYAATFSVLGTTALWSVRVVATLAVALTALLLALEARRRYGERAAWLAGLLFVLASVSFAPQDGQAANFEVFMLPAMTAAILLSARGRGRSAGVAVAVATMAKQTGAATLLPVLYLLWRARGKRGVADAAIGFSVPVAIVALLVGPGELLFWTLLGNGSYFGLGSATAYVAGLFALMTLAFIGSNLAIVWSLPLAWRERKLPSLKRSDGAETDGQFAGPDTDLWIWLASAALSVAVGFRFFGHYYLQLVPPLCLLTAGSLVNRRAALVKATVAFATVAALTFSLLGFWVKPWGDHPKYEMVSEYLDTHTTVSDKIFVWGHMPEIYWKADRRPASRFLTSGFPIGDWGSRPEGDENSNVPTPGAYELMMEDLRTRVPRYILDTTPAAFRGSQYSPMSKYPELRRFVDNRYEYVRTIDGIDIYENRTPRVAIGRG
jgi:4-amino-4-deoxy-L-arabinose transferase-like glycosyltransferase